MSKGERAENRKKRDEGVDVEDSDRGREGERARSSENDRC